MSCLSPALRARLLARKALLETRLSSAELAFDDAMTAHESYRFDSGEAMQQVKQRKLDEFTKLIDHLEAQIDNIYRRLRGTGVHNIVLRRRGARCF